VLRQGIWRTSGCMGLCKPRGGVGLPGGMDAEWVLPSTKLECWSACGAGDGPCAETKKWWL
jgi:hypothetical protein